MAQKHDADLNDCCEHQDNGKTDVQISKSRAAPVESLIQLFTFFAHASSKSDTATHWNRLGLLRGTFRQAVYNISLDKKKQYLQSRLQIAPVGLIKTWNAGGDSWGM